MKKENLKNQLAQKVIDNKKELFDLKKALLGFSPYKEGEEINFEDAFGEKFHGQVENVRVETEGFCCPIMHFEDGSIGFAAVFLYNVRLYKKNGELGSRTVTHTIEIAED
jgi:hypothetical protein